MFVGESIVWKTDKALSKGDDVVVCLQGANIEAITEMVEKVIGPCREGSVLINTGTNREDTTAVIKKCKQFIRTPKQ